MMGNFPQAFSHIALVNTALNLTRAVNPATQRGREQSPPGDGAGAGPGTAAGGSQASS
jgi:hypothetical protein